MQAARLRAAQEREQRIADALARLPEMAAAKRRNGDKPEDARASTTDADASNMKMGDGGFRPAYNVQFATDCASQNDKGNISIANKASWRKAASKRQAATKPLREHSVALRMRPNPLPFGLLITKTPSLP